ncbi:MAG: hypothetical protein JNM31_15770 [Flavobacteriales bacterium]|nr:hypothetical protein [Flavobacteriales bacterium]
MRALAHVLLPLLLLCCASPLAAQDQDDYVHPRNTRTQTPQRPLKDRLYWGGIVGLTFGTVTNIAVEPLVGYKFGEKQKFSLGTGISYWYFRDNRYTPAFESNTYGYKFFARHRVIPQAFLHVEYNAMNFELYDFFTQRSFRSWVPFMWVGGGYAAHLGGNSYLTVMALWDVMQDINSPFTSGAPLISMGVGVGF